MLLQAVIEAQGVTLARAAIAQNDPDSGRLVRQFDVSIRSYFQYYFACLPERLTEPDIQRFYVWLRQELHYRINCGAAGYKSTK